MDDHKPHFMEIILFKFLLNMIFLFIVFKVFILEAYMIHGAMGRSNIAEGQEFCECSAQF